jgi:hypothetical protein
MNLSLSPLVIRRCMPALALTLALTIPACGHAQINLALVGSAATGAGKLGSLQAVTADFNGDGILDIATTNMADNTVSILMGISNGEAGVGSNTFKAPVNYSGGFGNYGIAAADLNGDGKPDLVITNSGANTYRVLLNKGDGTFLETLAAVTTGGTAPFGISLIDINQDGKLDIAIANSTSNTVTTLLGRGNGTFGGHTVHDVGTEPYGTAVGDFNKDGYPDLIAWNIKANTVTILTNHAGTSFIPTTIATGSIPYSVTVGDFNKDGYDDFAVANLGGNTLDVFLNNKAGGFVAPVTYTTGAGPTSVITKDLDGDGNLDLAVTNYTDGTVSALRANGDGTFAPQMPHPAVKSPYALIAGNFNSDPKLDLAVTNFVTNSVAIIDGTVFSFPTHLAIIQQPATVAYGQNVIMQVAIEDANDNIVLSAPDQINVNFNFNNDAALNFFQRTVNGVIVINVPSTQIGKSTQDNITAQSGSGFGSVRSNIFSIE